MMRTSYHAVSGIVSPHQAELPEVLPELGRALFRWIARHTARESRRHFRAEAARGKLTGAKAAKQRATAWYLIAKLAEDVGRTTDAFALKMGRGAPSSLLHAFSAFASWYVRESDTTRVAAPSAGKNVRSGRRWPRYARSQIRVRLAAYRSVRATANGAPESSQRDPLARLHREVCDAIANTALVKNSLKGLDAKVDIKWPTVFASLSQDGGDRIALAVGQILVVRADRSIWAHDLDFKIEPLLREVVVEVTRLKIRDLLLDPAEAIAVRQRRLQLVCSAIVEHVAHDLLSHLEVVAAGTPIPALADVRDEVARVLVGQVPAVEALISATDFASSIALGHDLVMATSGAVVAALRNAGGLPGVSTTFRGPPDFPWRADDLHAIYNAIVAYLYADRPFLLRDVLNERRDELPAILRGRLDAHFGVGRLFKVAIPTTMRSSRAGLPMGDAASEGAVVAAWSVTGLAPLTPTSDTIVLVREVSARDEHEALHAARLASEFEANVLWFAFARSGQADITDGAYVLDPTSGKCKLLSSWRPHLGPATDLTPSAIPRFHEVLTRVRHQTKPDSAQADIWRRLGAGISFFKTSLGSRYVHERILYLWLALEAVFANFEWETEPYEKASPIGTRIAHRCATTLPPRHRWPGMTYAQARWGVVSELQALYRLRCATVHEGQDAPATDHVTLGRWIAIVENTLAILAEGALEGHARTVEEVVAFYEARFPGAQTVS